MATKVELIPFTQYEDSEGLALKFTSILTKAQNRNVLRRDFPKLYPSHGGDIFDSEFACVNEMRRQMGQKIGFGALAISMSDEERGLQPTIMGRALYKQFNDLSIGTGKPLTGPHMRMWLDQTRTHEFGPQGITILRARLDYLANKCDDPNIKGTPWSLIRPDAIRPAAIWSGSYYGLEQGFAKVGNPRDWERVAGDRVTERRQLYIARFTLEDVRGQSA